MTLDYRAIALAQTKAAHYRVRILEKMAEDPKRRWSPKELSQEFEMPLGNVSYHVRELIDQGFMADAGTASRRGAVEHYYRLTKKAMLTAKRSRAVAALAAG